MLLLSVTDELQWKTVEMFIYGINLSKDDKTGRRLENPVGSKNKRRCGVRIRETDGTTSVDIV